MNKKPLSDLEMIKTLDEANELNTAGLARNHSGDFEGGAKAFQQGLKLIERLERTDLVKGLEAALSGNLGQSFLRQNKIDAAIPVLECQIALATEVGDAQSLTNALNSLALCFLQKGNPEVAEALFQKRLRIAREIGDKKGEGNTLNNLATIYMDRKEYGPAIALLRQRVTLARSIDDRRGEASSLMNLGSIHIQTSQLDQATTVLQQTLTLMRSIEDPKVGEVERMLKSVQGA